MQNLHFNFHIFFLPLSVKKKKKIYTFFTSVF